MGHGSDNVARGGCLGCGRGHWLQIRITPDRERRFKPNRDTAMSHQRCPDGHSSVKEQIE